MRQFLTANLIIYKPIRRMMMDSREHQEQKLKFQEKQIKDQEKQIAEQTKRIAELHKGKKK
jgi:hypothetical protein